MSGEQVSVVIKFTQIITLSLFNIAMENGPFIDGLPSGGWPTPLKNMSSSWEGWHPIYEMEKYKMFQTTNQW